ARRGARAPADEPPAARRARRVPARARDAGRGRRLRSRRGRAWRRAGRRPELSSGTDDPEVRAGSMVVTANGKERAMKVREYEFMSVDGVVQAPGGPDEDTDGGFAHGGWSAPYFDPEVMGPVIGESMNGLEALLFGRRTWRVMADAWPARAGDPYADQMNAAR